MDGSRDRCAVDSRVPAEGLRRAHANSRFSHNRRCARPPAASLQRAHCGVLPCHLHARPRRPIPPRTTPRRRNRPSRKPSSIRPAWIVLAPPESNSRRSSFRRPPNRDARSRHPCGSRPSYWRRGGERRSACLMSRRFPAGSVNGSAICYAISSLRSLPARSRSNSSPFAQGRVMNAATATAPRMARSARTRPVSRSTSRASSSPMAKRWPSSPMGMSICVPRSMPSA